MSRSLLVPARSLLLLLAAVVAGSLAAPSSLEAQRFTGRVVDGSTGEPISGAVLRTSPGDFVEVSGADGSFVFFLVGESLPVDLTIERVSYAPRTVRVEAAMTDLEVALEPAPLSLEGLLAGTTFQERFATLETTLDRRYAEFSGIVRSVDRDVIAQYDADHDGDPYVMLSSALDLWWDFDEQQDVLRALRVPGGFTQFEVYLNDRRVPLTTLVGTPNESLCRAEVFYQAFFEDVDPANQLIGRDAPSQLRAYTCDAMARVAGGLEGMPSEICFGGVAAWANEPVDPTLDQDFGGSNIRGVRRVGIRDRVAARTQTISQRGTLLSRGQFLTCVPVPQLQSVNALAAR